MPCYHPLRAERHSGGVRVLSGDSPLYNLLLPCGQCHGCRLERSRQWAMRCMHEASLYDNNCFITLTYNPESVPEDGGLNYRHFQLFMKRLRKHFFPVPIRFYMAGEYGGEFGRPHFHACLFNIDFLDRKPWRKSNSGNMLYTSATLETLWPYGFSSVGSLTFESAAYVARYIMKKVNGTMQARTYEAVSTVTGEIFARRPEFNKMSLKPGIGSGWYDKFHTDVFPHDRVVVNGTPTKPPKYYDKLLRRSNQDLYEKIKNKRFLDSIPRMLDNRPSRLLVKEIVSKAATSQLKRGLLK